MPTRPSKPPGIGRIEQRPVNWRRTRALALIVAEKLQLEWSPHQIAGWLKYTYPDDENYQVSHETIYLTLFIQARGALKKELIQYLRKPRAMRRSRHHTQKTKGSRPDHQHGLDQRASARG